MPTYPANYNLPAPSLPDYADGEDLTTAARAADLALLDEAIRLVQALADGLAKLPDRAELGTTGQYIEIASRDLADSLAWLTDARRELDTALTRAEHEAYLDEHAIRHAQLWRR